MTGKSKKYKYVVLFYSFGRIHKFVCTRTPKSVFKFALRNMFKYGIFLIRKLN